MSITISFSMKPAKNWIYGQGLSQSRMEELAKSLAGEQGYYCDVINDYVIYQFCPEGFLWMSLNAGKIVGDCQTNIAGPGFHAAVIHFLELFSARGELRLEVQDITGYDKARDFTAMRRNYFYQWFMELMEKVLEKKDHAGEQLVCWPLDYYLPEEKKDMVTTHIRQFSISEIAGIVNSGIGMAFAKDFFIWNEEIKDAYYYRNCAMVMLNQECYFMPSKRSLEDQVINRRIIEHLEQALEMDPEIPFPKKEYLELCQLAEQEPMDVAQVNEYAAEIIIGCRRGLLFRTIGCIRFAVPGWFLYDTETNGNSERYYDEAEGHSYEYYICACHTEGLASFQETAFEKQHIKEVREFQAGMAQGKLAIYQPEGRAGAFVYSVAAQIVYKNQMTIISIHYDDPKDQDWAVDLIQRVQTIE